MQSTLALLLAAGSTVLAQSWSTQYTATGTADVAAARATAKTLSPTSHVKGKAFDRLAIIWLENTDYDLAAGDPNLDWLAKKGIKLTNHFAVTHPSEPNYVAVCPYPRQKCLSEYRLTHLRLLEGTTSA
jgi:hypothetical protein